MNAAAILAALILTRTAPVFAGEGLPPGDVDAGRAYATRTCSDCHRVGPPKDGSAAVLKSTDFDMLAQIKGLSATSLNVFLVTPHPTMPNLIIQADDRANVIAYILSLRIR
jgi:mono/diheme cytochrome c family protein